MNLTTTSKLSRCLAQANRARSGERDPLAQANPSSPRRGRNEGTGGSAGSRSGEPLLAQASPFSPR